jgi:tRNA (cmo5U34)-methyltransferase
MATPLSQKATLEEIRARFDDDVERFSNLETGQSATIDAPLAMELITAAAVCATPDVRRVLDIGCGAGNNTIRLRQVLGRDFDVDLVDLSGPMLERARERVAAAGATKIRTIQGDFRTAELADGGYDVVLAAAVLHHLRDEADWERAFARLFRLVAPGGGLWITDLVSQELPAVQQMMWHRYGDYLCTLGGAEYRDKVLAYVDREDSPRPVTWQLDLLRKAGFARVELLHKNSCFAAFGAVKGK